MSASARDRKLRVVTLVDAIGTFGGGERVARQITTHLDPSRFEATFCVTRWDFEHDPVHDAALEELRAAGVIFFPLLRNSRLQLRPWRSLVAYMREWRPDILHSHMVGSNIWGALIAPRVKVPVFVAHEHTWSFEGKPWRRFLDRELIARRADAFVAVSREDRRRMTAVEGIPAERTRFIPNGIPDLPAPDPSHDVRAELGIGPDQPVVGMVAVLRPQKAVDVILRAAANIRDAIPDAKVLLVGGSKPRPGAFDGDPYSDEMRKLAAQLSLDSTVSFLGARSDVADVISLFDVAVLSSDYEGSPLSVLEYMDAAKPVVATSVGGVPDLVQDGVTGLLVEPRDPEALARSVVELLKDPKRAAAMGEAGRTRRHEEFSIGAMVRRVEELYEELYAAKAPGPAAG